MRRLRLTLLRPQIKLAVLTLASAAGAAAKAASDLTRSSSCGASCAQYFQTWRFRSLTKVKEVMAEVKEAKVKEAKVKEAEVKEAIKEEVKEAKVKEKEVKGL